MAAVSAPAQQIKTVIRWNDQRYLVLVEKHMPLLSQRVEEVKKRLTPFLAELAKVKELNTTPRSVQQMQISFLANGGFQSLTTSSEKNSSQVPIAREHLQAAPHTLKQTAQTLGQAFKGATCTLTRLPESAAEAIAHAMNEESFDEPQTTAKNLIEQASAFLRENARNIATAPDQIPLMKNIHHVALEAGILTEEERHLKLLTPQQKEAVILKYVNQLLTQEMEALDTPFCVALSILLEKQIVLVNESGISSVLPDQGSIDLNNAYFIHYEEDGCCYALDPATDAVKQLVLDYHCEKAKEALGKEVLKEEMDVPSMRANYIFLRQHNPKAAFNLGLMAFRAQNLDQIRAGARDLHKGGLPQPTEGYDAVIFQDCENTPNAYSNALKTLCQLVEDNPTRLKHPSISPESIASVMKNVEFYTQEDMDLGAHVTVNGFSERILGPTILLREHPERFLDKELAAELNRPLV